MRTAVIWVLLFLLPVVLLACSQDDDDGVAVIPPGPAKATCQGCHTDQQMLMATVLPDIPPEDEGEG